MKILVFLILFIIAKNVLAEPLHIHIASDYVPEENAKESDIDMATRLLLAMSKRLESQLTIQFMPASRIREWRALKLYPNTCLYNKVKNKSREQLATFSDLPLAAFPANRLVLRGQKGIPSDVSLELLLDRKLRIAITKGRSYGKEIDAFIAKNPDRFILGEGEESAKRLRKMLMQKRFDGMIEYTSVFLSEYADEIGANKISFHRITDQSPSIFGYIACAKSPSGDIAIELFNSILSDQAFQEEMILKHNEVFSPQERGFIEDSLRHVFSIQY